MFIPLRSPRLLIRAFEREDVESLWVRRNHPEVARYQNWSRPYRRERAEQLVASLTEMAGPQNDEWWMAAVCHRETGEVLGDLALHLTWQGRTAEVGYTFHPHHWGKGYATEALDRLVAWLFDDVGVTRVFGMLHPENVASAMVLERTGFVFEGHTRSSYWVGDECSDDWIYGLLRSDREAWRDRPRHPPSEIRLVEIDAGNERAVYELETHKTQEAFVAPMAWSYADALFPEAIDGAPLVPWLRAVEADGELVGFVMLALRTEHHPEPYLWRLLVDRLHQRRGIGARVLELIANECRAMGDTTLLTSWREGRGSPRDFYLAHGFQPDGKMVDGETEARRQLA